MTKSMPEALQFLWHPASLSAQKQNKAIADSPCFWSMFSGCPHEFLHISSHWITIFLRLVWIKTSGNLWHYRDLEEEKRTTLKTRQVHTPFPMGVAKYGIFVLSTSDLTSFSACAYAAPLPTIMRGDFADLSKLTARLHNWEKRKRNKLRPRSTSQLVIIISVLQHSASGQEKGGIFIPSVEQRNIDFVTLRWP